MAADDVWKFPPWVLCPHCSQILLIQGGYIDYYFLGQPILCSECQGKIDWWDLMLNLIRDSPTVYQSYVAIGANVEVFKVKMRPGATTNINLGDYGLPSDGRLLDIAYAPQGPSLSPLEVHGNYPQRHWVPREITIYPYPQPDRPPTETDLAVLFVWVPHTSDDESWQNLVDAFEAYIANRLTSAIVPANVAVESSLKRLLLQVLCQTASRKNVEDCLDNGATYSHQLNVLLPAVLAPRNIPLLPNHIRGTLNRLRDLRNDVAHDGRTKDPLDRKAAAELLCAALFGFRYIKMVEGKLLVKP